MQKEKVLYVTENGRSKNGLVETRERRADSSCVRCIGSRKLLKNGRFLGGVSRVQRY